MPAERVTVVVKIKVAAKLFRAYLDEKRLLFHGNQARIVLLQDGSEHALMWFIRDRPGTSYEISVTEPSRAKMAYKSTLDGSGSDAGVFWFKL